MLRSNPPEGRKPAGKCPKWRSVPQSVPLASGTLGTLFLRRRGGVTVDPASPVLAVPAAEAAAVLGLGRSTFDRYSKMGLVPDPVYLGTRPRWRVQELVDWLRAGAPPRDRWHWTGGLDRVATLPARTE